MLGEQMEQLQHSNNNNSQGTSIRNTTATMTNSLNDALNAESNNNNEQLDTDMADNELTPLPVTQPSGENEYDDEFVESPSEFDSIILDAETKKRLAETIDSNVDNDKKNKAPNLANKTRNRTGKGQ